MKNHRLDPIKEGSREQNRLYTSYVMSVIVACDLPNCEKALESARESDNAERHITQKQEG